jgi:outer membrane receptor protein involved in Fe transport
MTKVAVTLFLIAATGLRAFAHLGILLGTVTDQSSNLPLRGVTVRLTGTDRTTVSNELGQFRLEGLIAASYKVELSSVGYHSLTIDVSVGDDQIATVKAAMTNAPIQLKEVVAMARQAHYQQLISNLDIKLRPVTNSQEILRMVPGLFIGQHAGGGKAEQIFLRGFDLDHGTDISLTVDGMPVNMVSHAHGQGYADLHFVIPELVETVDFKKGTYNTDKGNLATAGWADFRTRTSLDRSFVKVEAGQFDTYRAVAGIDLLGQKGKDKNQSACIASEYSYTNSYFDNPQNFNRLNITGKYHGHVAPNMNLTLSGSTFWSKWNHSGQMPDRAVESGQIGWFGSIDPTEGGETSRTNFNARLVSVTPKNHVFKQQLYYSNYNFELYSNFTFFLKDSINGDQIRQKERRNLFGYNGSYAIQSKVGRMDLTSTLGAQYRQDITNGTELSHTLNRTQIIERQQYGDINEINASLYADENVQITDKFSVNAGVRFDFFRSQYRDLLLSPAETKSATQSIFSPKLNLYYTFNPRMQLYLNSGKGFHSNDARVVTAQNGRQILPAAYGSDFGLIIKPFSRLLVNAAAWYLWMRQEFVYVGDEGVVEPSGRSRRLGLDLSARYQITENLFADVDLNTAKPRSVDATFGQNYLPLAPVFTSTGGLSLKTQSGFNGSMRYRYIADRPANEDNSVVAKGYFVNDLQLNYSKSRYSVGLSIQNLFNTRWKETQFETESRLKNEAAPIEEVHFTPGTPFAARLSVTYFW